jgi:hypothetical protein
MIRENINREIILNFITEIISILNDITINAPKITTCINLYKTIKGNDESFIIDKEIKQKVINSVTCSRETNIGMFISKKDNCCLLEISCKPGTPVLFLDYNKTAYGANMYEVILPPGVIFKPIMKEMKDILTYRFDDIVDDMNKLDHIKPFIDLKYKNPYVKNIQTYFVECYIP